MQYMIINYVPADGMAKAANPDSDPEGPAWGAYTKALIDAGVMKGGNALHGAHAATTVRVRGGKRQVQDGPYAESKEQLGGYYIIDVPTLDVALEWAAKSPAAKNGAVEVRPIFTL
jgi:hypothetical protein